MSTGLAVRVGQHSTAGRKQRNQDFHGVCMPQGAELAAKGIALALADGISSSDVSLAAAQAAVDAFVTDYYCTSEAWSVRTAALHVLSATNAWLHAQTRRSEHRFDRERGYVCTFSGLILKSTTAHLFHIGDARIHRLRNGRIERLTEDHRVRVSAEESYLARALGMDRRVDADYRVLALERGDLFMLSTDGVHDYMDMGFVASAIAAAEGLDGAARTIVDEALRRGSPDNLTVQLVEITALPDAQASELGRRLAELPLAPALQARMRLDGYTIVRELHASARSHVHLAVDDESGVRVAIKTPSIELQQDSAALERSLLEEWIARRIDSPHVLRPWRPERPRSCLYVVTEFVEGRSLRQWMTDHPRPALDAVRDIVRQTARGLQAFHRQEMLHRDLRPENIIIDASGTVRIIDFGAVSVAGIAECAGAGEVMAMAGGVPGDSAYAAPEYFLGEPGSTRSDLFSLAAIAYELLTGRLPYGVALAQARTRKAQRRLRYRSVVDDERDIPAWIDDALSRALDIDPARRQAELSEFVHEIHHPDAEHLRRLRPALIERDPAKFWKVLALVALLLNLVLLQQLFGR
ncbi:protein kinase domain-containing protein [Thauera sp. WH-2]|uniref:protein kinase domain-containing protein n=1 Tax=Thauera sp. WH-2 TaxID=3401574 RepID=UPI003AB02E03